MANLTIGSNEVFLIKQPIQRRYTKVVVMNRAWNTIGTIQGRVVSGNISIDAESDIRRTASLSIIVDTMSLNVIASMTVDSYIQIKCGIENNATTEVSWYNLGIFIINQSGFTFDPTTRTLNLSLADMMLDLTGGRAGILHAYTSLVKNQQRIDDVMKNVLKLAGYTTYDIAAVGVQRKVSSLLDEDTKSTDYDVPYDKDFSVGVSAYDILSWCISLYPYYEMYFDTNGTFVCQKLLPDGNTPFVLLDDETLRCVVLKEDKSIDWTQVKNWIEVWGKDGKAYGEAKDTNPSSPFNVNATQPLRYVVTGNEHGIDNESISDRYKNADEQVLLEKEQAEIEENIGKLSKITNPTKQEKEKLRLAKIALQQNADKQAQNISIKGNDLAEQFAEYILYQKARMNDTITLETISMPFVTDVNFLISYSSDIEERKNPYIIKSVNHDIAAGTTTLTGIRFYNDQNSQYWEQLPSPVISSYDINGMTLTVVADPVEGATSYSLVIDGKIVATSTGTTLMYTVGESFEGEHTFYVRASADGWRDGISEDYTVEFSATPKLITNTGLGIVTDTGLSIAINIGDTSGTSITTSSGDTMVTNNGDTIILQEGSDV